MADIDAFLRDTVEKYLLQDLKKMSEPGVAIGFPLAMTVFSGMELLGGLLYRAKYRIGDGEDYFLHYWETYLYPDDPERTHLGKGIYIRLRHSIAHAFVLTGDIGVSTGGPDEHLKKRADGLFIVDAVQLAADFVKSYEGPVREALRTVGQSGLRSNAKQRLDELAGALEQRAFENALEGVTVNQARPVSTTDTTIAPPNAFPRVSSSVIPR